MIFVNDPVLSLAMREIRLIERLKTPPIKRLGIFLTTLGFVGILLGLIGPFGTFNEMPTLIRFVYWISLVILNGAQAQISILVFSRFLAPPRWPTVVPVAMGGVVSSLLGTLEVMWLDKLLRPGPDSDAFSFAEFYFSVLIITLVISFLFTHGSLRRLAFRQHLDDEIQVDSKAEERETSPIAVPFLKRLPHRLGDQLICIEVEDHYIRAHTTLGNEMFLMRIRDAVAELEGFDGMQVHRSYWVARDAIVSTRRSGERALLTLRNGMEIPVSRTRLRELVEKKLLEI